MAPIHHHFELKGWAEPKIIVRFWIIAIMLALVALASLKLQVTSMPDSLRLAGQRVLVVGPRPQRRGGRAAGARARRAA